MTTKRNKKDEALRMSGVFLLALCKASKDSGNQELAKDCKTFADLCFLALPMKYRLTRKEFEELIK